MKISIDLKCLARLLGCMEWVWIFCLILLCIGQSIGTDVEIMDLTTLTWLMMINTMAILWIVFRLTRQSVEDYQKEREMLNDEINNEFEELAKSADELADKWANYLIKKIEYEHNNPEIDTERKKT